MTPDSSLLKEYKTEFIVLAFILAKDICLPNVTTPFSFIHMEYNLIMFVDTTSLFNHTNPRICYVVCLSPVFQRVLRKTSSLSVLFLDLIVSSLELILKDSCNSIQEGREIFDTVIRPNVII